MRYTYNHITILPQKSKVPPSCGYAPLARVRSTLRTWLVRGVCFSVSDVGYGGGYGFLARVRNTLRTWLVKGSWLLGIRCWLWWRIGCPSRRMTQKERGHIAAHAHNCSFLIFIQTAAEWKTSRHHNVSDVSSRPPEDFSVIADNGYRET